MFVSQPAAILSSAQPDIDVMPTTLNFGAILLNTTAPAQTVTVRNMGTLPLVLGTLTLAGADAARFSLSNNLCDGMTLAPMATCTAMVAFSPLEERAHSATLSIPSNDPDENPFNVALSGTGMLPPPDIDVMPTALNFGVVQINTTAPAQTVTVQNMGMGALVLGTLALTGADAARFSLSNNLCDGMTLAPMATCTAMVAFSPLEERAHSATLSIPSNDPDANENPFNVALSGTGIPVPVPDITAMPTALDFGAILLNTTAPARLVTVQNTGTAPLDVGALTLAGADMALFSLSNNTCDGMTLAPMAMCTAMVAFTPLEERAHSATLSIPSNDPDANENPLSVTLAGTGVSNRPPTANAGPDQTVMIPAGTATVNVTLNGSASSDPDGTIASFQWTGTPDPADVAQPTVALGVGTHTFTLVVTDNLGANSDPDTVVITVPNRPPTANAQSVSTGANTPVNITLTGSDPDGQALTFRIVTQPANGRLSGTPPNVTYTPNSNFTGSDAFTFVANDRTADSAPATVSINVASSGLTVIVPESGQIVAGNAVPAAAEVALALGVNTVRFQFRAVGASGFSDIGTGNAPNFITAWDTTPLADGAYELRAMATSSSGTTLISSLVQVTVDNPPFTTTPDIFAMIGGGPGQPDVTTGRLQANEDEAFMTSDGVLVKIRAGTLNRDDQITIVVLPNLPAPNPQANSAVGMPIDISLASGQATFRQPIILSIPYEDANQDGIVDGTNPPVFEADLTMWFFNGQTWVQVTNAIVDPLLNIVVGQIDHFTPFGLFQRAQRGGDVDVVVADDGGGCALMPAGPFGFSHLLAALGNIFLPLIALAALRAWSWWRRRH